MARSFALNRSILPGQGGAAMTPRRRLPQRIQQAAARDATDAKKVAIAKTFRLARATAKGSNHSPNHGRRPRPRRASRFPRRQDAEPPRGHYDESPPPLSCSSTPARGGRHPLGSHPANEHKNARPEGTRAARYRLPAAASQRARRDGLAWISRANHPPSIPSAKTMPVTYAYRARYFNQRIQFGLSAIPWSSP